jgi:protein-S-isoprenylcysteine O-methyltransferase Ste14
MMKRVLVFLYGTIAYVFFLGVFLYAIGFVGNIAVPKSIDTGISGPVSISLLVNALLLGLFAIQHTIMARPAFKTLITRIIPKAAERSTFVMAANLAFVLLFVFWRPLTGSIWHVEDALASMILQILFWAGWGLVLLSTFLIDHFDLFGLKQVTLNLLKKEYRPPRFREAGPYKYIRHPIMLGFLIAFWATPDMTAGHLFFSILTSGYILVGITFEERDLIKHHGEKYLRYARRVPRLIPFFKPGSSGGSANPELKEDEATG